MSNYIYNTYKYNDTDGQQAVQNLEYMSSKMSGFSLFGWSLKHMDKAPSKTKTYYLKHVVADLKTNTFKKYMLQVLEDVPGTFWVFVVPLAVPIYFLQKRALKKYIKENQEYLI